MCVRVGQAGDPAKFCVPLGAGSRQLLALASLRHRLSDPGAGAGVSMADQHTKHEPVGLAEIGERLNVQRDGVEGWRHRGLLPEARWTVGGQPAWCWRRDIEP
jgi:hypothetical protein